MLSATVHDVLYYMSPIYCQDIINSVSNQLNLLYLKFLKRNPGYDGKVSIYGHSLGSVLSYDILCHQENLSSPFPMNWMYQDHTQNESSSPNMNNQSSEGDCMTNPKYQEHTENENSSPNMSIQSSESDCMTNPNDKNFVVNNETQPTLSVLEEEHAEVLSVPVGHPVTSDSETDEPSVIAMDPKQPNGILSDEDVLQPVSECSDMISHKMNGLNESTSMKSGVTVADSQKISEEVSDCDKDRTLKSLQKEIDFLKTRIAELESQYGKGKEEITTMTNPAVSEGLPPRKNDTMKSYTPYIKYTKLEFKVNTFFAVGSPLGVFLSLRNIRIGIGKGQEYWEEENISEEMPACRQMFNIFHPFDPVAYRLEPLICKEYISKRPVIVPYHRGGKRLHIGLKEFAEDCASRSQAVMDHLSSIRVKVLTLCQSKNKDGLDEESENAQGKDERSYGSMMMERLTGSEDGRLDHVLQDKTFQHQYISAIGSHTNYWRDFDTALFILKHLYRDIPEEHNSTDALKEGSSRDETGSEGWSDQREAVDEELPLTFSEGSLIRNFSTKERKIMKKP